MYVYVVAKTYKSFGQTLGTAANGAVPLIEVCERASNK
jgi:hypothetical protein